MKIIDAHMHLWNPNALRYAWLDSLPALNRPFLPSDFFAATPSLGVSATVFVQADCLPEQGLEEVKWVSQIAADKPVHGIVAFIALELGDDARPALDALTDYPLVKGVRRLIQSEDIGFSVQPEFVRGVQLLADYDFSFDICIRHYHLPDIIELVSRCPNITFILDHLGKPDIAAHLIDQWRNDISALAQFENVWCKLSGIVTEADHANWRPDDLRPYAHHMLDVFGSSRVMFGSDWPVCTLASSYERWFETARGLISHLPSQEQQMIWFDNANRFYRLGL